MVSSLYAWQAYFYCFKESDCIEKAVLPESVDGVPFFDSDQRKAILKDDHFGMNTIHKLVLWVIAADYTNVN